MKISNDDSVEESMPVLSAPSESEGNGLSGTYAVMLAISSNIPALQKSSVELMGLSVFVEKINEEMSTAWLNLMSGPGPNSIESQIEAEENSGDDEETKAAKINLLNVQYQTANTEYNNSNTFYVGMDNALNSTSSTVAQTMSVDADIMGNVNSLQAQTLARLLA